jgi:hypothetical protein
MVIVFLYQRWIFAIAKFQGLRETAAVCPLRPGRLEASLAFSVLMRVKIDVATRPPLRL